MKFPAATIKAIRHDMTKGTITLQFEIAAEDTTLTTADLLSQYADKDGGTVTLEITPHQLPLEGMP